MQGLLLALLVKLERRDHAAAWFVDVGALALAPIVAVAISVLSDTPWWLQAIVWPVLAVRVFRVGIERAASPPARVRRYWLGVLPGRARDLPFDSITTDRSSEDGRTNEVVFEAAGEDAVFLSWCLFPERTAEWLKQQRARLALAEARIVGNGDGRAD